LPLAISGITCAILGCWVLLNKASMVGDAMSHSVLPGLVIVFLIAGTRAPLPMTIGAIIAAVLTVWLAQFLGAQRLIPEDAGLGAVFSVFFAIGILLLTNYAKQVDLDPGCVLYGLAETIPLSQTSLFGFTFPAVLLSLTPMCAIALLFSVLLRKELLLSAFDPGFALQSGFRPKGVYFLLMSLVAIVVVASFEIVGSILVLALLIGPSASAQLWTKKVKSMMLVAGIIAAIAPVLGYFFALWTNTTIAGMTSVICGVVYAISLVITSRKATKRLSLQTTN
jgi:manganese/zinc/iron transport system permease protein